MDARDYNGADGKPPFKQGVIMLGGIPHSTPLILQYYGVSTQAEQPNSSAALVPLTKNEADLLNSKIELQRQKSLLGEDIPKPAYSKTGDRNAYGGPAAFGTAMKTAKGGGLVQAANGDSYREIVDL